MFRSFHVRTMPFIPFLHVITHQELDELHTAESTLFLLGSLYLYQSVALWYCWHGLIVNLDRIFKQAFFELLLDVTRFIAKYLAHSIYGFIEDVTSLVGCGFIA